MEIWPSELCLWSRVSVAKSRKEEGYRSGVCLWEKQWNERVWQGISGRERITQNCLSAQELACQHVKQCKVTRGREKRGQDLVRWIVLSPLEWSSFFCLVSAHFTLLREFQAQPFYCDSGEQYLKLMKGKKRTTKLAVILREVSEWESHLHV